ncbi:hypothetical protein H0A36_04685 [Endozoicomonas sp. SM1973]|uniref:Uncharacterized protein n=1 Tax=Spartinivicinus marinus TaxID=2994442 RepID=A0A853I7U8_9GAMM|nr:hypothetical protein [Spartinivicinus marinus]MCX4025476.1 hypothetical protein [Spartinivicinus marinus]NYZ65295.1 hypothetical protein [Spartinivicinus marinus]
MKTPHFKQQLLVVSQNPKRFLSIFLVGAALFGVSGLLLVAVQKHWISPHYSYNCFIIGLVGLAISSIIALTGYLGLCVGRILQMLFRD